MTTNKSSPYAPLVIPLVGNLPNINPHTVMRSCGWMQDGGSNKSFLNSSFVFLPFSLNAYKLKVKRMCPEVLTYVERLKFNLCECMRAEYWCLNVLQWIECSSKIVAVLFSTCIKLLWNIQIKPNTKGAAASSPWKSWNQLYNCSAFIGHKLYFSIIDLFLYILHTAHIIIFFVHRICALCVSYCKG